jgi:hypothetical protein
MRATLGSQLIAEFILSLFFGARSDEIMWPDQLVDGNSLRMKINNQCQWTDMAATTMRH